MHGEYKVPGGKLVVIDLDVEHGRLTNVALSGDFFLAPDHALTWITSALEGLPADTSETVLTEQIQAATSEAELLGITPVGVAIAIRRALAAEAQ
jgi:lipoate-protein ligase A